MVDIDLTETDTETDIVTLLSMQPVPKNTIAESLRTSDSMRDRRKIYSNTLDRYYLPQLTVYDVDNAIMLFKTYIKTSGTYSKESDTCNILTDGLTARKMKNY
jgi:hypothetical protein